jgi:hypothetical protein
MVANAVTEILIQRERQAGKGPLGGEFAAALDAVRAMFERDGPDGHPAREGA